MGSTPLTPSPQWAVPKGSHESGRIAVGAGHASRCQRRLPRLQQDDHQVSTKLTERAADRKRPYITKTGLSKTGTKPMLLGLSPFISRIPCCFGCTFSVAAATNNINWAQHRLGRWWAYMAVGVLAVVSGLVRKPPGAHERRRQERRKHRAAQRGSNAAARWSIRHRSCPVNSPLRASQGVLNPVSATSEVLRRLNEPRGRN